MEKDVLAGLQLFLLKESWTFHHVFSEAPRFHPVFFYWSYFFKQIQLGSGECTVGYAVKWNVPFLVGRNLRWKPSKNGRIGEFGDIEHRYE